MAVQSPDSTYLHTYSVFFLGRNAGHVSHQNITPQEALFFSASPLGKNRIYIMQIEF